MAPTREYQSSDGRLRLVVVNQDDGDVTLGFDGFSWHTHAGILAAVAGISEAEAIDRFVQDLIGSRAVIAVSRIGAEIMDVWVSDDPSGESRFLSEGESIELRLWDGRMWSGD